MGNTTRTVLALGIIGAAAWYIWKQDKKSKEQKEMPPMPPLMPTDPISKIICPQGQRLEYVTDMYHDAPFQKCIDIPRPIQQSDCRAGLVLSNGICVAPSVPVTTENTHKFKVLNDVVVYDYITNEDGSVDENINHVIPADTIIAVPRLDMFLNGKIVISSAFGDTELLQSDVVEVDAATPVSAIIGISANAYENVPRELWNAVCEQYKVTSIMTEDEINAYVENFSEAPLTTYTDCNFDVKEVNLGAGESITITALRGSISPFGNTITKI
jgi:hypothetical protein